MDITLLHAGLAAGAALAAIPVILHLVMRQTPKRVIFPALQLIRQRQKRSTKRLRIKNWLLLLARMMLVALMALALARPALNREASLGDHEVPTALGLVFDTSLSMQYTERGSDRLTEAKTVALDLLQKMPDASRVFVVDSAEPGLPVGVSPAAARKRIESLELRPANRPLNTAVEQAYKAIAETDRTDLPRREVYVLTDMIRSSWDLGRAIAGLDQFEPPHPAVSTYLMRLGPKQPRNVAVVEAAPSAALVTQGEPVTVRARLRATGPATQRAVEFWLDGTKRDAKTVELPENGEAEVSFRSPPLDAGLHQGEVRLEGGTDPLPFDDRRYFSFQVQPALRVLVVSDLEIDAEYVANALDPQPPPEGEGRPFRVDRLLARQLAGRSPRSYREYAAVFLINIQRLPDDAWSALNGYVREGGGLVIALGDRCDPEHYNGPMARPLMPATIEDRRVASDGVTSFGRADFAHPLFHRFARELDADLTSTPVFRHAVVSPVEGARAILAYPDGAPALVERAFRGIRTGRVLLWTTPLSRRVDRRSPAAWNDWPASGWSFFYVMNQTVPYLAGATGERLNFEAGEDVTLPLDPTRGFTSYAVQGPDAETSDRLTPSSTSQVLTIVAPQRFGQWSVTASNPDGDRQTLGFSVNPPVSESQLAPLQSQDLDQLFGETRYEVADNADDLKRVQTRSRVGVEMFPWLMMLILMLITAENFLANRFYRERSGPSPGASGP